jgi:hypothetical protein
MKFTPKVPEGIDDFDLTVIQGESREGGKLLLAQGRCRSRSPLAIGTEDDHFGLLHINLELRCRAELVEDVQEGLEGSRVLTQKSKVVRVQK